MYSKSVLRFGLDFIVVMYVIYLQFSKLIYPVWLYSFRSIFFHENVVFFLHIRFLLYLANLRNFLFFLIRLILAETTTLFTRMWSSNRNILHVNDAITLPVRTLQ